MKKLRNKTFITIFTIISTFLIIGLIIVNVQNYNREYENIKRNLTMISPMVKRDENKFREPDIDNMMIMDYEVYTIKLKDDKITENTTDDTLNESSEQSEKSKKTPNYKNNKNNQKHNIKVNKLNKTSDSFKIKYSIILMLECLLLGISTTLLIVNNYNKKKDSNK